LEVTGLSFDIMFMVACTRKAPYKDGAKLNESVGYFSNCCVFTSLWFLICQEIFIYSRLNKGIQLDQYVPATHLTIQ